MIKAIIFDFFGVICSELSPVWFAKYFPQNEAADLKDKFLQPADRGDISSTQLFDNLATLVQKPADVIRSEYDELVRIDNDMVSFIQIARKNYKIGLCSNSPAELIRSIFKDNNLDSIFDQVVISGECGLIKPDPEIFYLILDKLKLKPDEAIFIDDNPKNVVAAEKLGIKSIVYTNLDKLRSDLGQIDLT